MLNPLINFQYIIIGAGTAGSVLANRLSINSSDHVLVLEAAQQDVLLNSDNSPLHTTVQPGMNNRTVLLKQGGLPGSALLNNAITYVRGNAANFEEWSLLGANGWSYEEVLPFFERAEHYLTNNTGNKEGEHNCLDPKEGNNAFADAAHEAGYEPHIADEGTGNLLQEELHKHQDIASLLLHPIASRPNLTVLYNAKVKQLIIENGVATGVEYIVDGETYEVYASNEIIVSAGAIASPQILLLSGIGPTAHLDEMGIQVVADLPGVGTNLQDHVQLPLPYKVNGYAGQTHNSVFVKTTLTEYAPDIQINFEQEVSASLSAVMPDNNSSIGAFYATLVQPLSRGHIKLTSANHADCPQINPNYLEDAGDVEALAEAITIIRKIVSQPAFYHIELEEIITGDGWNEDYIRSQSNTLWNPVGTCKMGDDSGSVVDDRLRVHHIQNLRVADASVMPVITSCNTLATCLMIGEKAAAIILEDNAIYNTASPQLQMSN